MKLSTAIREGAKKRPQCFGAMFELLFTSDPNAKSSDVIGSCAAGAAKEGAHLCDPERDEFDQILWTTEDLKSFEGLENWSCENADAFFCPVACCILNDTIDMMMIHLNDEHEWKREAIANWVEQRGY